MSKVLQCPHFISYGGLTKGCLLGYFPANCESCICPDKYYIEITTTTTSVGNSGWPNYLNKCKIMKLIDKATVVAEIENLLDKGRYNEEYDCAYRDGNNGALYALKNKLDTLEVKEVDSEKEIDNYLLTYWNEEREKFLHPFLKKMCVHFFELGIKVAQKGE